MKKIIFCLCSALTLGCASMYKNTSFADTLTQTTQSMKLSKKENKEINNAFFKWTARRAQIGNMAVSKYYFDHGPEDDGQLWYAKTPDGNILIRNASNNYSSSDYKLKAIGGVVFYTAQNGTTGKCNAIAHDTNDGDNYSDDEVDTSKPIDKYLLSSNGIVYECKLDGDKAEPDSGFCIKGDSENDNEDNEWIISQDKDAQNEYRQLIKKYTNNNIEIPINYDVNDSNNKSLSSPSTNDDNPSNSKANDGNDNQNNNDNMDDTAQNGKVIGDTKTHIYHTADQHDYKINPANEIVFSNEQQAINAGYRKAKR